MFNNSTVMLADLVVVNIEANIRRAISVNQQIFIGASLSPV